MPLWSLRHRRSLPPLSSLEFGRAYGYRRSSVRPLYILSAPCGGPHIMAFGPESRADRLVKAQTGPNQSLRWRLHEVACLDVARARIRIGVRHNFDHVAVFIVELETVRFCL